MSGNDWRGQSFRDYYAGFCNETTDLPDYRPSDIWQMFCANQKHFDLKDTVAAAVLRLRMLKLDASAFNVRKHTDHLRPTDCSDARWRNILKMVIRIGMPRSL